MPANGSIREKQVAALASVTSAVVLVSLKIFLTIATHSLGVLSEALHSSLDLIAAVVTYLSVRVSDQPADERHPYGHGKFESFSAFIETGLLLLTALYIIWEAIQRIFFQSVEIHPSLLALGLLVVALVIDVIRSRALWRVAEKYSSEALEADALHYSTDVWSTLTVIFGIAAVWVGTLVGAPWLRFADPIAALAVAGVVIFVGARLGKRTMEALLDVAPPGMQARISQAITQLEGVLGAERVRLRRAGNRHFVDVTITVPRTASFEQVHEISESVEKTVGEILPADVMVHMEPRARSDENLFEAIRATAQRRGLAVHEVWAQEVQGRFFVEMHLEVDAKLTLREAHEQATELEREIQALAAERSRPGVPRAEVTIHIEPLGSEIAHVQSSDVEMKELGRSVEEFLTSLRTEFPQFVDAHEAHVRHAEHRIVVSCHCRVDGSLPITTVHDLTAVLEDRVKKKFPQISRVTIHPEPAEDR